MKSAHRILATLAVVLNTTLGLDAQTKDNVMAPQVFYRTVSVDGALHFLQRSGAKRRYHHSFAAWSSVVAYVSAAADTACG
jgi:hypothetical protein